MESDSEADFVGRVDNFSKREFNKIQKNLTSSGFREGASAGKEAAFQSGFDAGYTEGFKTAYSLGKFNGVLEALRRNAQSISLDMQELDGYSFENTRHGLCQICKDNSEESRCKESSDQSACSCKNAKDILKITDNQRAIAKKVFEEQRSKCLSVFEKTGVSALLLEEQE